MKFSCERCGKKYATADPPAPGKVYKLKCRACGHLIVIRVSDTTANALPAGAGAVASRSTAARPSGTPPVPARRAPGNGAPAGAPQTTGGDTSRVSLGAATPAPAAPGGEELLPAPADPGYVDLFSDLGVPEASARAEKADDALLAAARASLPKAYQGAADPLAPLAQAETGAGAPRTLPVPHVPEIALPPPQRNTLLLVLMGVGIAVIVGILAFVLLGSAGKSPVAPPRQGQPDSSAEGRPAPEPAKPPQEPRSER